MLLAPECLQPGRQGGEHLLPGPEGSELLARLLDNGVDEDERLVLFAGPADEPADLLLPVQAAIQQLGVAHAGLAVDLPTVDVGLTHQVGGMAQGLGGDR